jgi:hypothetical protein
VHNRRDSSMRNFVQRKTLGRHIGWVWRMLSNAAPRAHLRITAASRQKARTMHTLNRAIMTAVAVTALATAARPLAAQTVAECYEKVLTLCAAAMEDARWYEKAALGVVCTAMLVGCNTTVVVNTQ